MLFPIAILHIVAAPLVAPEAAFAQDSSTASAAAAASATASGQTATQSAGSVSDADRAMAEKMISSGSLVPDTSHRACVRKGRPGEIVVCAPDEEQFRVDSSADSDPTGKAGTNDGRLRPPNFEKNIGGVSVAKGCFIPPCPPAQPLIIDLSQIPQAPAGSDADLVAKGELRAH